MRCPFCSSDSTRVIDSRLAEPSGDAVRRRRECEACEQRFTTYERIEEPSVTVLKRGGRRERFDRQKLLRGLVRAANKRPVSDEQLETLAESIAAQVRRGGPEVEAGTIGDLAERGLAVLDPVAAIQFASVYRNLRDLDELEAVVRRFKETTAPGPSDARGTIDRSPQTGSATVAQPRRVHVRQP